MPNTILSAISIKRTNILTTIIRTDAFQFIPCLSLNQGLKILEHIKYMILGLQREYPEFARMIINKSHKVKCTTMRPYLKRTTQIRMYQLQQIKLPQMRMTLKRNPFVYRLNNEHTSSTLLVSLQEVIFS